MRVAYVLSRFPTIVETFILREIIELDSLGLQVLIFPIILEKYEEANESGCNIVHPLPLISNVIGNILKPIINRLYHVVLSVRQAAL